MTKYKRGGDWYLRESAEKRGKAAKAAMKMEPKSVWGALISAAEDKSSIAGSKTRERGRSPSYLKKPRP